MKKYVKASNYGNSVLADFTDQPFFEDLCYYFAEKLTNYYYWGDIPSEDMKQEVSSKLEEMVDMLYPGLATLIYRNLEGSILSPDNFEEL